MKLKIEITMDNAAFDPFNGDEAARILRDIAGKVEGQSLPIGESCPIRDINGNAVGKAKVTR